MPRKGTLAPGVEIETTLKAGGARCQFVKAPKDGETHGVQCKQRCEPGRPRCRFHGGRAGAPIKTGKHSKYHPVPTGLQAKFEAAAEDPNILDLTQKIALLDSQIWQICEDAQANKTFSDRQQKKLLLLIAQQRKLIGQETDRRVAMGTMLDVKQVMTLIGYIYDSIIRHVADEKTKRAIGDDLRQLVGGSLPVIESADGT